MATGACVGEHHAPSFELSLSLSKVTGQVVRPPGPARSSWLFHDPVQRFEELGSAPLPGRADGHQGSHGLDEILRLLGGRPDRGASPDDGRPEHRRPLLQEELGNINGVLHRLLADRRGQDELPGRPSVTSEVQETSKARQVGGEASRVISDRPKFASGRSAALHCVPEGVVQACGDR